MAFQLGGEKREEIFLSHAVAASFGCQRFIGCIGCRFDTGRCIDFAACGMAGGANTGFTSNITACIPLTIQTLPEITIGNTGFTSNITACIPLTIQTLPEITIGNTSFNSIVI